VCSISFECREVNIGKSRYSKEDARICKTHNYSNQIKLAVEEHTMKPMDKLQLHSDAG
jgi:hypothetical protein